jgi:tetratricopeptide (TPR) repeat protein
MAWVERTRAAWDHWDFSDSLTSPLPEALIERFREDQEAFDIRFLEDVLARLGEEREVLEHLGHLYTRTGRYRDGLAVDQRLVALKPRDPIAYYNLACSHSLLKQAGAALAALRKAIELGYRDFDHMQTDPDLEHVRGDPRWADLVNVPKP